MERSAQPSPRLGLWDVVSMIVGIVVGAGIYKTPPLVLHNVSGPGQALGVWMLGGLLSLVGALCYAELASAYPYAGGDYVYLNRAFGPLVGFLFAWMQLVVVRAANIGMMAFIFADYAAALGSKAPRDLSPDGGDGRWLWAAGAVVVLTLLQLPGVVLGKGTQNVLTAAKVLGLGCILVAGFGWPGTAALGGLTPPAPGPETPPSLALALVLVFITYGGWNDAAFVAAEVRGGPRNIVRALLLGTAGITLLYVLVNAAYLWGLGWQGARQSGAIAADVLAGPLGLWGARAMCVLVMISSLGAVHGMIFSGARVYATLGSDYPLFAWLGRWHARTGSPWAAILGQSVLGVALIALIGSATGRDAVNALFRGVGLPPVSWQGRDGFEVLLVCTTPVFWLFSLLTGLSLFRLRRRDVDRPRPFRVPAYPLTPLIFCGICTYMLYAGIEYARHLHLLGSLFALVGLLGLAGLVLYRVSLGKRKGR